MDWATFIDGPTGVYSPRLLPEPSGGFYMASNGERPLIKFAADRSISWEITPTPGVNDLFNVPSIDLLPNGDTVGLYSSTSPQGGGARLFGQPVPNGSISVARLTSQGSAVWLHQIANGWAYAIAATSDGGYAVAGYGGPGVLKIGETQIDMGAEGIFLARFGTALDWSLIGRTPGWAGDNSITAISVDSNGEIFFAGQTAAGTWTLGETNLTGPGVFLGRVSAAGHLRWGQIIPGSRDFRALDKFASGPLILGWSDTTRQDYVGEFSIDGQPGWKMPIQRAVRSINAGSVIAVTGSEGAQPNWILEAFNHQGTSLWRKGAPGRDISEGQTVAELADGHLVFAGYAQPTGIFLDNFFAGDFVTPALDSFQVFAASLDISANSKPQFKIQPTSQKAILGESVTLLADVYSPTPAILQWYRNNQLRDGETGGLLRLHGFQVASAGEYYLVAQNEFGASTTRVAQVTANSATVTTLAGSGIAGFQNNSDPHAATFKAPKHPAILGNGSVVIADSSNQVVRRIDLDGVSTYAGQNQPGLASGAPLESMFSTPTALAAQPYGLEGFFLYVADSGNNAIRNINVNPTSGVALTVSPAYGASTLQRPTSVATHDGLRYMVVSEENGTRVWKLLDGDATLIAGGDPGFHDGPAGEAKFGAIAAVAMDARANIYIADKGNHSIRKIDVRRNVTTIAGTNSAGFQDGLGIEARFNQPSGLAVDSDGNIFVTEIGNNSVRKISPAGNVTTLTDTLNKPEGLATRADGALVIADTGNNQVKELHFTPLNEEALHIYITAHHGLEIHITGPPGEYWIESTDQLPAPADWQFETALTILTDFASQPLVAPVGPRFYRARRVN